MPTTDITTFGLGRVSARTPPLAPTGSAAVSLNLLHNRGADTAKARSFVDRVNATAPAASAVLMLHELVSAAGEATLLAKVGAGLYTWSLTPTTDMTPILSGLDPTYLPGVVTANGLAFIADHAVANYVTSGTAAHSHELQKSAPEGTMTLGHRVGTAGGNAAGTISYYMTDTEPTTGEETPPSSATTIARLADEGVEITGLTYTGHFTGKKIYRTKYGDTQPYLVTSLAAVATATRARTSGVATLTTAVAHGLQVGQSVTVSDLGGSGYNGTVTVASTPTTTSFTYSSAGPDEGQTADTGGTVQAAGYLDDSLDTDLVTASDVLDENGSASIEKPEAAKCCCFFKGALFLGNLDGHPTRIRKSRVGEPTQFSNATTARFDVGKNDGGSITGLVPFRGSLVIFKTNSIWVLNGDADETSFTLSEAVPGLGAVSQHTIRCDGDIAIRFLSSEGGIASFDLGGIQRLSDAIEPDLRALADRAEFFCAGYDPVTRVYQVSVAPAGETTNTATHVLNLDTGAWGQFEYAMGQITPSCYSDAGTNGPIHNADGRVRLYFGDTAGFVYCVTAEVQADGVTDGTDEAAVTGYTAASRTITCAAAAFRTTGSGLAANAVTLRRAADNSYETKVIESNTDTTLVHAAGTWAADPVPGDTIFVGAMRATLALNRLDLGTNRKKRWVRLEIEHEEQASTTSSNVPCRVGYTLEGADPPTAATEYALTSGYVVRHSLGHRRAVACAPYLDIIGTDFAFELIRMTVEAAVLAARRPVR